MPLLPPRAERTRVHQRRITLDGYQRVDGLWDIEASLLDTKDQDFPLSAGLLKAGEPVHAMHVRVTIDRKMNIFDAVVCTDAAPYMGFCDHIVPVYARIAGLNLFQGFLRAVKAMFGGTHGCTHLSELLMFLPTAALQTVASEMLDTEHKVHQPYHLDRCHALATHAESVRHYYPRWFRPRVVERNPAAIAFPGSSPKPSKEGA